MIDFSLFRYVINGVTGEEFLSAVQQGEKQRVVEMATRIEGEELDQFFVTYDIAQKPNEKNKNDVFFGTAKYGYKNVMELLLSTGDVNVN